MVDLLLGLAAAVLQLWFVFVGDHDLISRASAREPVEHPREFAMFVLQSVSPLMGYLFRVQLLLLCGLLQPIVQPKVLSLQTFHELLVQWLAVELPGQYALAPDLW